MRLVEMGVEPFLVTSALDCVVAQRLARRLCDKCKEPYQPTEAELVEAGWSPDELTGNDWPTLQRAVGCSSCGKTGYRGRFAIHEVLLLSEEMERLIIERRSTEDLVKMAVMEGMITLKKDGLRKVGLGLTSLEEIFRVVASPTRQPGSRPPGSGGSDGKTRPDRSRVPIRSRGGGFSGRHRAPGSRRRQGRDERGWSRTRDGD